MRLLPCGARRPGRPPPRGATTAAAGSAQGLRRRRWARAARGASNASPQSSHGRPRAPRRSTRRQPLPSPSGRVLALLLHGRPQARRWLCSTVVLPGGGLQLPRHGDVGRRGEQGLPVGRIPAAVPPLPLLPSLPPPPSAQRHLHRKFAGEQLPAGEGLRGGERLHPAVGDFFSFFLLIFMK